MKLLSKLSEAPYIINKELTGDKTIDIFATEEIAKDLEEQTIKQAVNTANTYGVDKINLNADAHIGYGCPIGSVVVTKDTIMPGPIGYDISCSMSYLQTNLPVSLIESKKERRKIIDLLCEYIPNGAGKKRAKKQIKISNNTYIDILRYGASKKEIIEILGINLDWLNKLERTHLEASPDVLSAKTISRGEGQLGSLGSGNHFLEGQKVDIIDSEIATKWGITNNLGFLTHCGSRGLGHQIATEFFDKLYKYSIEKELPVLDKELVYVDAESNLGNKYLLSMGCAANFAIVNHLVINNAIISAMKELYPDIECDLLYHISHNLAQKEVIDDKEYYIHRKGATRAFPKKHEMLKNTDFYDTGHPVIIPGSSISGSSIMVGIESGKKNFYTTPHGCGRAMGRREAKRVLKQDYVNSKMEEANVLTNQRNYPIDEFSEAYKNYDDVINAIEKSGLAREIAKLKPLFVLKDN
ncbi:MAG: RtcB family protein [Vampirovibrionia bacterium]